MGNTVFVGAGYWDGAPDGMSTSVYFYLGAERKLNLCGRLIYEAAGEFPELVYVGEVGSQAHGYPDRAGSLSVPV